MFSRCSELTTIYVGDDWNTDNVTNGSGMFLNCNKLVGGRGTTFDASHTNYDYAHIDGGESNPGYFTAATTDGIANVAARALLIRSEGGMLVVQGADDGQQVGVYSIDGTLAGTAVSKYGQANVATSLRPGSVAIVKIGGKSLKVAVR